MVIRNPEMPAEIVVVPTAGAWMGPDAAVVPLRVKHATSASAGVRSSGKSARSFAGALPRRAQANFRGRSIA